MRSMTRKLIRDNSGATMLEFTVGAVLFFGIIFAIADFTRALWLWNSAEKATQIGVRAAIITDPVATELATFDCDNASISLGTKCSDPLATSFGTIICTGAGGSCGGGYTFDAAAANRILSRMQVAYPSLQLANVNFEYRDVGLGFAGREGPVPSVTVRLTGLTLNFIALGAFGLTNITMPDFKSTLIGEDLSSAARP